MSELSLKLEGQAQAIEKLKRLGQFEFRNEFAEMGNVLVKYYSNEAFLSQGGVYGKRWPGLKTSTIEGKIRGMGAAIAGSSPATPLIRTGTMQRGFQAEASSTQVRVSNPVPYFKYHQLGTNSIPQRVMIDINATLNNMLQKIIVEGFRAKVAKL